jgi:hypothetical protein
MILLLKKTLVSIHNQTIFTKSSPNCKLKHCKNNFSSEDFKKYNLRIFVMDLIYQNTP